jgi:hypothetical protein
MIASLVVIFQFVARFVVHFAHLFFFHRISHQIFNLAVNQRVRIMKIILIYIFIAKSQRKFVQALRFQRKIVVRVGEIGDDDVVESIKLVFEKIAVFPGVAGGSGAENENVVF